MKALLKRTWSPEYPNPTRLAKGRLSRLDAALDFRTAGMRLFPHRMNADGIEIRLATEAELPAIGRLADVIWHACYPGLISREQIEYMLQRMYSIEVLTRELRELDVHFECLLRHGELIGFAAHGPAGQPEERKLHKLYLHPQWHGQGMGSRLLRHCEIEARRLGAQRMVLTVNKHNARAIAAYHRNGFEIREAVVADIGGGFVMDDFLMSKRLTA